MTDRKTPGVAFWATVVAFSAPLLYVLSFGPACWITSRTGTTQKIPLIYLPFTYALIDDSGQFKLSSIPLEGSLMQRFLLRFAAIGMDEDVAVLLPPTKKRRIWVSASYPSPNTVQWETDD
jgi:hypothetical protein